MPIDPTLPADDVAAEKGDLRDNLQAAKDGIEAAVTTNANTSITVNAASFGDHQFIKILCTSGSAITVSLAADVLAGRAVELVRYGAGNITAQAGSGASLVKPTSATHATTEQYEALVYEVDTQGSPDSAAWRLVARP